MILKKNIAFGIVKDKEIDLKIDKPSRCPTYEFSFSLNNGLDTKLGEFGDRISGGERRE